MSQLVVVMVLLERTVRIVEVLTSTTAGIVVRDAVMGSTRVVLCEVTEAVALLRQDLEVQGSVTVEASYLVLVM